jgi:hypothetical protein
MLAFSTSLWITRHLASESRVGLPSSKNMPGSSAPPKATEGMSHWEGAPMRGAAVSGWQHRVGLSIRLLLLGTLSWTATPTVRASDHTGFATSSSGGILEGLLLALARRAADMNWLPVVLPQ